MLEADSLFCPDYCLRLSPASAFQSPTCVNLGNPARRFGKFGLCGLDSLNGTIGNGRITGRTVPSGDRYPIFPCTEMVLLMKSQKRSRLFRALICSSAAVTAVSQAFGQDGVTRVSSQPPTPDPVGADGVASTATQNGGVAQVPTYALPEYIPPTMDQSFRVPTRTVWQDELGPRYMLETRIGEWLGSTDQGATAVNVMLPFSFQSSNSVVFLDARGTTSWDGGGSGSIGAGLRWYDEFRNRITGVSAFWDYDDSNERSHSQAGVSIESVGKWFTMHANGYINLGDDTDVLGTRLTGALIPGTPITAGAVQNIETTYSGFNIEIGGPTPLLGRYGFESYIGGYHFQTEDAEDATGFSFRTDIHVTDDLRIGINATNDDVFDTEVFGTVSLTLPDGRPKQFLRPRKVADKILDRVERRYRVTTDQTTREIQVPVTTLMIPAMGGGAGAGIDVQNVVVVDPNSPTNGVGTFDDPFNTFIGIPTPGTNTLTLVRSGNVQGQYNLAGNNLLLSEAFLNQQIVMMTTSLGTLQFPGLNPTATIPVWSNPAGNPTGTSIVNILGDNTEIAGFIFEGRTTSGISNSIVQASNVQGVSIHDNIFRNYRQAISLQNVTGEITTGNPTSIYSNDFLGMSGQSIAGFVLENNGQGVLDLELGATEFNLAASSGSALGNFASGNSGEDANGNGILDAGEDLNRNFALDTGTAYSITARNRAVINARVVGNIATEETDANGDGSLNSEDINNNGILDAGEDTLTVDTLTLDTDGDGIPDTADGIPDTANGVLDFGDDANQNGQFDTGNGTGFVINAGAVQSRINLTLRGNTADRNIGDGVFLAANSSVLNAAQLGEDVNGNGRLDGFEDLNRNGRLDLSEDTNGNGMLDLTEDLNGNGVLDTGEDANGNGLLDLSEDTNGNGRLDLSEDLNGNGILDRGEDGNEDTNGNGVLDAGEDRNGDGFLNLGDGDGRLDGGFIIVGNTLTRNGGDGLRVDSTNIANVDLRIVNNTIGSQTDRATGNQGIGINATADSGELDMFLGFLYFEDVNLNGVLDPGEDTNGNGALDSPPATSEDANGNGILDAGEDANGNGRLDSPFLFGNQIIANAGGGVNFGLTGTADGQLIAIGNSIQGTGGGSLNFAIAGGAVDTSTVPFSFVNSSIIGVDITNIVWNLAPAAAQIDSLNPATPFNILNNSATTTGLVSVNGDNDAPFAIPNLATTVDVVFNSFNPINNTLDPAEDLNANGVLDPGEDLPDVFTFDLDIDLANGTEPVLATDLFNSRVDVTFSTGQQISGLMQPDPLDATAAVFVADSTTLPGTTGFAISTAGNSTLRPSTLLSNQITSFGGDGISVSSFDDGNIQNLLAQRNNITGNFGIGANFQTNSTLNAQLNASLINNNLARNTLGGITATATGGTLTLNDIERNSLDEGGSGIRLTGTQGGTLSARITNNAISNSVIMNGSTGNGVEVTADGAILTLLELANNTINTNAGNGVTLQAINGGSLLVPPSEDLNGNGILDSGEDNNEDINGNGILDPGEDVNTDGQLNVGNGNGRLDRGITTNSINNNAGDSFSVTATALSSAAPATVSLGNVTNNQILFNTSGTGGFMINGVNANITGQFTANRITGNPAANTTAGPGFLSTTSGGTYNMTVGGPNAADGNIISQVRGAGIAFVMTDTGTGSFVIQGNQITDVDDDTDPQTTRNGDGISISLEGSTALTDSTAILTRSEITGNMIGDFANPTLGPDGSGIAVLAAEDTTIQDLLISANMVGNAGQASPALGIFPPSYIDDAGIRVDRLDDARFDAVNPRTGDLRAVTIENNIVRNNGATGSLVDGLQINAMNGMRDDIDFEVRNNEFSGNTGNGVQLNTQADASLGTDLRGNLIENNDIDGIALEGVEVAGPTFEFNPVDPDLETQGGTWIQNTIRNNTGNGISVSSVSGTVIPLIIGQNGTDPFTNQSLGNVITDNGGNGIIITGGGEAQINNNLIARNAFQGIDIEALGIGFRSALIQNNSITENLGTGLEIINSETAIIVALGNSIDNNAGRGVDILNRFDGTANIRFGDGTLLGSNNISSNGFEGFYVVNSASNLQAQGSPSLPNGVRAEDPLSALNNNVNNSFIVDPDMVLDLNRNTISANNNSNADSLFSAGGFALRVGTSNSAFGFGGATQIADETGNISGAGFGQANGVGANSALFGNGRVNARVIDNTFEGNLGDDVYIESFVSASTVQIAPPASGTVGNAPGTNGTWNDMQFIIMAYTSDPLARLNLVFRGNVGNTANVTNAGAFYNDGDGTFKSRTIMMAPQPTGPFTSATRRRNAQRVPDRAGLAPFNGPDFNPLIGEGIFQYPGTGVSTFRVESDFDLSGFQTADGFAIDGDFSQFNQIPFTGANLFGELPFGWGTAAPGSFQFDDAFIGVAP